MDRKSTSDSSRKGGNDTRGNSGQGGSHSAGGRGDSTKSSSSSWGPVYKDKDNFKKMHLF